MLAARLRSRGRGAPPNCGIVAGPNAVNAGRGKMPLRMTPRRRARPVHLLAGVLLAAWAVVCLAGPAVAQTRDEPYGFAQGRVTFGGELAGMLSPRDDDAFFNYTDYERDALRMA